MDEGGEPEQQDAAREAGAAGSEVQDGEPGSETERFRAVTDLHLRQNEAVTGESGVPRSERDHEHRRQLNSLAEFS